MTPAVSDVRVKINLVQSTLDKKIRSVLGDTVVYPNMVDIQTLSDDALPWLLDTRDLKRHRSIDEIMAHAINAATSGAVSPEIARRLTTPSMSPSKSAWNARAQSPPMNRNWMSASEWAASTIQWPSPSTTPKKAKPAE
jgi:hypothetical protein